MAEEVSTLSNVVGEIVNKVIVETNKNVINTLVVDVRDPLVTSLIEKLKVKVGPIELNGRTLMVAMRYAMELVEMTKLKGEEQKQMVIRLLRCLVIDAPLSEKKESLCLQLINKGIVGQTIDLVVDATRGNINVNSVVSTAVEAFVSTKCCGLF